MNTNSTDFALLVTGFLTDYLPLQRNYSKNTVLSYRDTMKLFIRYLTEERNIKLQSFEVKDLKRDLVIDFLEWYRQKGASSSSANQKLAAFKTFSEYAQIEKIEYMAPLMEISNIKSKKASSREIEYLSVEQMTELLKMPDVNTSTGFRHRLALTLLYDSGCRVQELCDLTLGDIFLNEHTTVRLHGKGSKTRTVVVSDETGKLLKEYKQRYCKGYLNDHPLITNRYHKKIDRDGVGYIVKKYAKEVRKNDPSFPENVHCHMFRHSKAMHMLEAKINIIYIRDYLGHEDISTTMDYVRANNRKMKEAINALAPMIAETPDLPDWSQDKDLLDFLNALK